MYFYFQDEKHFPIFQNKMKCISYHHCNAFIFLCITSLISNMSILLEIWTSLIMFKVFILNIFFRLALCLHSQSRVYIFLRYFNEAYPHCIGTLVSYKHVLTSAKCVRAIENPSAYPSIDEFIISKVMKIILKGQKSNLYNIFSVFQATQIYSCTIWICQVQSFL